MPLGSFLIVVFGSYHVPVMTKSEADGPAVPGGASTHLNTFSSNVRRSKVHAENEK
jgi:hypothetical protein